MEEDRKVLEIGQVYKVPGWRVKEMEKHPFDFLHHVLTCGNRFLVLSNFNGYYRVKCLGCDWSYHTSHPGWYELVDNIPVNNPNILFKRR